MKITTFSSRKFNQDVGSAKKATHSGPVFITDRGSPAHVLLTIKDYLQITGQHKNVVELLTMPDDQDIEFEPPRLEGEFFKPADFS